MPVCIDMFTSAVPVCIVDRHIILIIGLKILILRDMILRTISCTKCAESAIMS